MGKNIVICIDGTENQIEINISNVLKVYRVARQTSKQVVYYDQGIGTIGLQNTWKSAEQERIRFKDSAFGQSLDQKVIGAYEFLVSHYEDGDKIYLFGFSRGAYAVRALAGMIYLVGLLKPDQVNLSGSAYTAYKDASLNDDEAEAWNFKRISKARTIGIEFLGIWDTVSSVFRPDNENPWGYTRQKLKYTENSPAVKIVRHAMAIDERRRMFRVERWLREWEYKSNPHSQGERREQDVKEVWFAGSHSDVGGGYERENSALSQIPFLWMVKEAEAAGLDINERMRKHVGGIKRWSDNTKHTYPAPSHLGMMHDSMTAKWKFLEYLPKSAEFKEWPRRRSLFGLYFPCKEPRFIKSGDWVHQSAFDRTQEAQPEYRPINWPADPQFEQADWAQEFAPEPEDEE